MMSSRYFLSYLVALCFILFSQSSTAQNADFMMQGWYWDYPKTCDGANWANTLEAQATELGDAGITMFWMPPFSRASSGSCSNGYDPKDLYDLGEYGGGATGFGTRTDVDNLVTALDNEGIISVADVVYNHRDGGAPESNPAVKDYITTHFSYGKSPYPSDRFRCVLPLGGSSGNGAGDYYFKISSFTQHPDYYDKPYVVYMSTGQVGWQNLPDGAESEPNGGGDCGEPFNDITLGRNFLANVDGLGCKTDEFKLSLDVSDFDPAGDFLYIFITNQNGDYSDHRVYGIWNASAGADVVGQLDYQTYTDFTSLPSGQGAMNFENFRPHTGTASTEELGGDWNWMWFFYDYDQDVSSTKSILIDWTKWLWNNVGMRGFRMDAIKHFNPAFVSELLNDLHNSGIDPPMVVGEYFDDNAGILKSWVDNVTGGMSTGATNAINVRIFDFALRKALKDACDGFNTNDCFGGGQDARKIFSSGIVDGAGGDAFNVVTFANNHDFRDAGQPIQNDPLLAYAYILTNNQIGLPTIFYPDFYNITPPNYPATYLQGEITCLIDVHQQYIYGSSNRDYLNRCNTPYSSSFVSGYSHAALIYQLQGGAAGKDVIVAINFAGEELNVFQEVNMTNLPSGETFTDVLGRSSGPTNVTLNGSNQIQLRVPSRSYSVWVQGSVPVVPIGLSQFEAKLNGAEVVLSWETVAEENLDGFEIERSSDGINFEPLHWAASKGNPNENTNYEWIDQNLPEEGKIYYRLKAIDLDGSYEYSPIKSVQLAQNSQKIKALPNPFGQTLEISIEVPEEKAIEVRLYNTKGQLVLQEKKAFSQSFNVDTTPLSEGLYYLQVIQGERKVLNSKVIKID